MVISEKDGRRLRSQHDRPREGKAFHWPRFAEPAREGAGCRSDSQREVKQGQGNALMRCPHSPAPIGALAR